MYMTEVCVCVRASVHTCTLSESTRGPTTDILACGWVVGGERLWGGGGVGGLPGL